METLEQLLADQAKIAEKIRAVKEAGREAALASVLKTIKDFELTMTELKGAIVKRKPRAKNGEGVVKNQGTGAKRGRPPKVKTAE